MVWSCLLSLPPLPVRYTLWEILFLASSFPIIYRQSVQWYIAQKNWSAERKCACHFHLGFPQRTFSASISYHVSSIWVNKVVVLQLKQSVDKCCTADLDTDDHIAVFRRSHTTWQKQHGNEHFFSFLFTTGLFWAFVVHQKALPFGIMRGFKKMCGKLGKDNMLCVMFGSWYLQPKLCKFWAKFSSI